MMKLFKRLIPGFFFVATSAAMASSSPPPNSGTSSDNSDLTTYLVNLGQYLGYDLTTSPTSGSSSAQISDNLLNLSATQVIQNYLFNTVLGSMLVNTAGGQGATQFVPSSSQAYAAINAFANYTFTASAYATPSPQQVSVSPLIDQPNYQSDPVSQSVLNILGTPDFSYCLTNDGSAVAPSCNYASSIQNQNQVLENVVGTLPSTQDFFTYAYNQAILPQLNINSLISPLLYTTSETTSSTSSSPNTSNQGQGLTAQNQAQQAANFIRYASGAVAPAGLASRNQYDTLYQKAMNLNKSYTPLVQAQSQATLASYLASLRVFAAQSSVAISNLYYILSKRLPQSQSTSNTGQQSSQALSEFTMATWRLYNPDQTPNTQWLAQINQASSATVQKEIASLLAEINYQLYLNRQQEERILLTNSIMLLQNARTAQPTITSSSTSDDLK